MAVIETISCTLEQYKEMCKNKQLNVIVDGYKKPIQIKLNKRPIIMSTDANGLQIKVSTEELPEGCELKGILETCASYRWGVRYQCDKIKEKIVNQIPRSFGGMKQFLSDHNFTDEEFIKLLEQMEISAKGAYKAISIYMDTE